MISPQTPIPPLTTAEAVWSLSGASLGGFIIVAATVLGGAIRYGPPMIGWLKARYLPPFSVSLQDGGLPRKGGAVVLVPFVAQIPRGDYVLTYKIQIGEWVGKYVGAPTPNTFPDVRKFWSEQAIPDGVADRARVTVFVEIQRVNGLYLQSRTHCVKTTHVE